MSLKKILLTSAFLFLPALMSGQEKKTESRFPTTEEVRNYVKTEEENIKKEFSEFTRLPVDYFYFDVDNLTEYTGYTGSELGLCYPSEEYAVIEERGEKFLALEKKDFEKIGENAATNAFVKGVMLHELAHYYFQKKSSEIIDEGGQLEYEYVPTRGMNAPRSNYGAQFIEEGFCEYLAHSMDEIALTDSTYVPKDLAEVFNEKDTYKMKYLHSALMLEDFLDKTGLEQGHRILVTNSPPGLEEILNPEKYFKRLKDTRPMHKKLQTKYFHY